jgi:aarF domain-containing kinase
MRGFNITSLFSQTLPWICTRQTHRQIRNPGRSLRNYATLRGYSRPRRRRNVALAVAGGATGVGALTLTDDVKHTYKAIERTGRVVGTLAVCINEWVLNQNWSSVFSLTNFIAIVLH